MSTAAERGSVATSNTSATTPEAIILDVAHGNAAVFLDNGRAIVVDAGSGDLVATTLSDHQITDVASVVISHRHHDHTSELPSLLAASELSIGRLFLNADPNRNPSSRFERDLRAGFNSSLERNGTELQQVNSTLSSYIGTERIVVEVLSPNPDLALGGIGVPQGEGSTTSPHAMAVVLRASVHDGRSLLLCADHDYAGFRNMIDSGVDLRADVLVYPHHGGLTGASDEEAFARELTEAVQPSVVVFSHGRTTHNNPRPEIVRGVRSANLGRQVRVLCTQLSRHCSDSELQGGEQLDSTVRSRGGAEGHSCAGSIRMSFDPASPFLGPGSAHLKFVLDRVPNGLCVMNI